MYLIFDIESKRVLSISEIEPVEVTSGLDVVMSDLFKPEDELEKAIFVQGYIEENGMKHLTDYAMFTISIPVRDILIKTKALESENINLKNKLKQTEEDSITTLEALAEVYEMLLELQS